MRVRMRHARRPNLEPTAERCSVRMREMAATENISAHKREADAESSASVAVWWRVGPEWWLLPLVAAAFLIRLWGMSKMHFWDEDVYLLNAEYFFRGHAGYLEIDSRPPLLSVLFAGAFQVWHSDYAAEIVTALLNALGPLFLYMAGRKTVGRSAGAIAALILAFGPFFAGVCPDGNGGFVPNCNGHSLLTDCPALTLIMLSLWLAVRALEKQTGLRFAVLGFCMAMAVLMRFGSLSSVCILALLVLCAKNRVRAGVACAAGFALGIGPYLCWSRIEFGTFLFTLQNGWWNLGGEAEPWYYFLALLPQMLTWMGIAGLALWFLRRGAELWQQKKEGPLPTGVASSIRNLRWDLFLWLWAAGALIFFSSIEHKESRYGIPIAAPLLLLAGAGLGWLLKSGQKTMKLTGALLLAAAAIAAFWPSLHRFDTGFIDHSVSNEMIVARYLRDNLPASTILYANANYPDFAYYSGFTVNDLPESGDALYSELAKMPPGSLLIAYKANDDGGSPAEPPISYLDADLHFKRVYDFPTMVVYKATGP